MNDTPHSFTSAVNRGTGGHATITALKVAEKLFERNRDNKLVFISCDGYPLFAGDVLNPSLEALTGHFQVLRSGILMLKHSSTPCIFQAARAFNQLLLLALNIRPNKLVHMIIGCLMDIYHELESRTKNPYQFQLAIGGSRLMPLPASVLRMAPFNNLETWKRTLRDYDAIKAGQLISYSPIEINEVESVSLSEEQFIPELIFSAEDINKLVPNSIFYSIPLVRKTIESLQLRASSLVEHILAQRKAAGKQDPLFISRAKEVLFNVGDETLHALTPVIIYHSVYSVLLDQSGNPHPFFSKICPHAECPILYPTHDFPLSMKRTMPPAAMPDAPALTFISMGKLADWAFMIEGKTVKQTLQQMVGGFYFSENLQTGEHPYQTYIQKWLAENHAHVLAAVSSPSAFNRKEMTIEGFRNMVPVLVGQSIPFVIETCISQIKNADILQFLKETAHSQVREILKETLMKKVCAYFIKTIGKKIVPLVNLAYAVKDIIEGEDERRQVRTIVACFRMAVQGGTTDDMSISAKVLSKVIVEKFKDAVQDQLGKYAAKGAHKLVKGDAPVDHSQPVPADQLTADNAGQHNPPAPAVQTSSPARSADTAQAVSPAAANQTLLPTLPASTALPAATAPGKQALPGNGKQDSDPNSPVSKKDVPAATDTSSTIKKSDPGKTREKAIDSAPTSVKAIPDQAMGMTSAHRPSANGQPPKKPPTVFKRKPGETGQGTRKPAEIDPNQVLDPDHDLSAIEAHIKDAGEKYKGDGLDTKGDEAPGKGTDTFRLTREEQEANDRKERLSGEKKKEKSRPKRKTKAEQDFDRDDSLVSDPKRQNAMNSDYNKGLDAKPAYQHPMANKDENLHGLRLQHRKPHEYEFHHIIPAEMTKDPAIVKVLKDAGINNIDILTVKITVTDHQAVHANSAYNREWSTFLKGKPQPGLKEIKEFADGMRKKYQIEVFTIEEHPNAGDRANMNRFERPDPKGTSPVDSSSHDDETPDDEDDE